MITLMTGTPGTGKTCHVVSELAKVKGRPIFVMGIPDLKVPHFPVPPVAEWVESRADPSDPTIKLAYFTFPPGSIVVVDEAQRVYRPRAAGSKVPDIVAAFETHRHTGVDFWLITQGPGLLDSNIRKLVTRHWHIHPTFFGSKLLEWKQCRDPDNKTDRGDATKSSYKPKKETFDLYKSAEVHTVVARVMPKSLIVVVVCSIVAVVLAYMAYSRVSARIKKPEPVAPAVSVRASASKLAVLPAPVLGERPAGYVDQFTPVHPNFPESAPAYDAIRIVKAMPVIAGCMKTAKWCRCYSQQGTVLDVQVDYCAAVIARKVFDPYRADTVVVASAGDASQLKQAVAANPGVPPSGTK